MPVIIAAQSCRSGAAANRRWQMAGGWFISKGAADEAPDAFESVEKR
ncbi:hypothetical protein [Allosphingosinicella indica]|nr:hypothetical protein [Allosphingosinicella indica]